MILTHALLLLPVYLLLYLSKKNPVMLAEIAKTVPDMKNWPRLAACTITSPVLSQCSFADCAHSGTLHLISSEFGLYACSTHAPRVFEFAAQFLSARAAQIRLQLCAAYSTPSLPLIDFDTHEVYYSKPIIHEFEYYLQGIILKPATPLSPVVSIVPVMASSASPDILCNCCKAHEWHYSLSGCTHKVCAESTCVGTAMDTAVNPRCQATRWQRGYNRI